MALPTNEEWRSRGKKRERMGKERLPEERKKGRKGSVYFGEGGRDVRAFPSLQGDFLR